MEKVKERNEFKNKGTAIGQILDTKPFSFYITDVKPYDSQEPYFVEEYNTVFDCSPNELLENARLRYDYYQITDTFDTHIVYLNNTRKKITMISRHSKYVYIGVLVSGYQNERIIIGYNEQMVLGQLYSQVAHSTDEIVIYKIAKRHIGGKTYFARQALCDQHGYPLDKLYYWDKIDEILKMSPYDMYDYCMRLITAEIHNYDSLGKLLTSSWIFGDYIRRSISDFLDPKRFKELVGSGDPLNYEFDE